MRHESPTPQTFNPIASQNGGGGLFGGSVQATGTFDFSAPAGGLSFPAPLFGATNNNPFVMNNTSSADLSGNESDSRADTTGEEAARAKRPFRGFGVSDTQQSNTPFQISNPSGQNQPGNPFTQSNTRENSGGNIFSFSGTSHPAINFNSTTTQEKPVGSIFSFGASSSQPAPSSPTVNFGSGTTQDKPGNNIFSFGQQPAQPAQSPTTNTGFNFGPPTPQDKPTATPFSFGQTSAPPSSSGISFGSAQAAEKPASNLFGSTQQLQTTPTTNIFGSSSQQTATMSNIFANLSAPASLSSSLFGTQSQSSAPVSSGLFGSQSQLPSQSTTNLFGSSSQAPAAPNVFGEQKLQLAQSSNLFESLNKSPASSSNLFSSQPVTPVSNAFGSTNKEPALSGDLFGHLNRSIDQPADKPESQPKVDGNVVNGTKVDATPSTSSNPASSVLSQTPPTNVFGGPKPLVSQSSVLQFSPLEVNWHISLFAPTLHTTIKKAQGTPMECALRCVPERSSWVFCDDANFSKFSGSSATPVESSNIKPTFSFGSMKSAAPETNSNNMFSPMKPIDAPTSASQPPPGGMFPSLTQPTQIPRKLGEESSKSTTSDLLATAGSAASSNSLITREETQEWDALSLYPEMAAASQISDESLASLVPTGFSEQQRQEFYIAFRIRALNKTMGNIFGSLPLGGDISLALAVYSEAREKIVGSSSITPHNSKRKVVDDEDQENENPSKRSRQFEPSNSTLSQAVHKASTSPAKDSRNQSQSQPYINGDSTSKTPSLAAPQLTAPTTPAPKGKRKAEVQLTKDDHEREEAREAWQIKTPKVNEGTGGSNTSNIFKNILDSPSKASPAKTSPPKKMIGLAQSSKDETPRFNPFGNLPVPSTTSKSNSSAPASLFAPKSATDTANPFQLKPVTSASGANGSSARQKDNVIKPPTFGSGPGNFLEQFGQQAKNSEEKLMKEAKEEDMDSDEDEAEWEAKYKEKRRAELKAIDDVAKNKRATFVVGKGFTFGQPEKSSNTAKAEASSSGKNSTSEPSPIKGVDSTQNTIGSKPLFGQNAMPQSSGNSIFGSLNCSRTSTPGPFTSPTGSVLDGHKPGKPMSFGDNIFAHLSPDSGADSGKGDNGDDESGDGETDGEDDSENKDPSYQPDKETPSSPGTPAEETGPGIASAKKTNLFSFGSGKFGGAVGASSNSGTSSPGGSIFDRITKDPNGKPIRHVSTEEKENTQPSTTVNVFGDTTNPFSRSFTKSPDERTDKTWNPGTPIKFGSATPNNGVKDPAPTVSVTEATPTKAAGPFANLFGNSGSSKLTSSLTTGPSSVGVGFGFGGPSSTTSSLFPSAAASTTTSRATSPGGTTDGDSAAEGDPDAERHEQIDLTKGGPGEEDEEVIHEVRAKALKFSPKEEGDTGNAWETKGIGPLRVLKHKETNAARIILRADPSGTIVLNKGILPQVNYEAAGKTLKLLTSGDGGKNLETWILQVKTPEFADALASVLESNKKS